MVSPTSVQASANGVSGLGDDTVDFSSYFSDPGSTSYLPVTPVITSTPGLFFFFFLKWEVIPMIQVIQITSLI